MGGEEGLGPPGLSILAPPPVTGSDTAALEGSSLIGVKQAQGFQQEESVM